MRRRPTQEQVTRGNRTRCKKTETCPSFRSILPHDQLTCHEIVSAHLNNTTDLLQRFTDTDKTQLKGKIPISFNVVSLYTNINNDEAIETALQYTNKYHLYTYGLEARDLFELLHLLLDNNIFTYRNTTYRQIRGLAMGNRLSGTLAILAMDRFERTFIYQNPYPSLTIYARFIDDIGTVVNNPNEAQLLLTYLNSKHPTIKFELEPPNSYQEKPNPKRTAPCHTLLFH